MNFLKEFGQDYGYPNSPKNIDQIRASEFKRLEGLVYLDHAGATLYSEMQMESILKDFTSNVYGNPHRQSDVGSATFDVIRSARQKVLEYCNAPPNENKCIFTSGETVALKLVGECFPWSTYHQLFKNPEAYDHKPQEKSVVQKVADAYELLGLLEEKIRVMEKYKNTFTETWRGRSKKAMKASLKKQENSGKRNGKVTSDDHSTTANSLNNDTA